MKKVKFILPAIGLISLIAGALAFKAQHRFTGALACYSNSSSSPKFLGKNYTQISSALPGFTFRCTIPVANLPYIATHITTLAQ